MATKMHHIGCHVQSDNFIIIGSSRMCLIPTSDCLGNLSAPGAEPWLQMKLLPP